MMNERQISTGEAAKISGLTIRALQHYDNIGLLPASGRTEGGRRFYTENDMVKLEHIVFYRGLGFSLKQIRENLSGAVMDGTETGSHARDLLSAQQVLLYNQIHTIQNSIAAIEASQEIIDAGKTPPWTLLAAFMQSLGTVDLSAWSEYEFSEEQTDVFDEHFQTIDDAVDFYNTWKRLSIKAAAFCDAGISPGGEAAQNLAKEWSEMVLQVTGGNAEHEQAFLDVDQQRDMWNPAERELIEKAEPFLDEILKIYYQNQ